MWVTVVPLVAILLVLALVGAGVVYMIRLGVQFALGDLVLAVLVVGFPPALGSLCAQNAGAVEARRIWTAALALGLVVAIYQVYGLYWASIRPAGTARARFWQRFGPPIVLVLLGAVILGYMTL